MQSERNEKIQKDNRQLFDKMVAIANTPHYSTLCFEEPPFYGQKLQKNLMANRVNKLKQIEQQNHKFLDRLQRVSSNFSVQKWEKDRKQ